jgi:hypothetical protein
MDRTPLTRSSRAARRMMFRSIRLRLMCAAVAGLAVGTASLPAFGADGGGSREIVATNIKHPDYAGRFAGFGDTREGRLLIKISERNQRGEPLAGLFQPKDIALDCVGNPPAERRYQLSPYVVYFHDRGRVFDGQDYGIDQFGYESVLLFHGQLAKIGATAKGVDRCPRQSHAGGGAALLLY